MNTAKSRPRLGGRRRRIERANARGQRADAQGQRANAQGQRANARAVRAVARARFIAGLAVIALLASAVTAAAQEPSDFVGEWSGKLTVPGAEIPLVVHLDFANGRWSGALDSPMQGARGLRLSSVEVDGAKLRFTLGGVPGEPRYEGELVAGRIEGTFSQSGHALPLTLRREALELPKRPQEPKPPFPYAEEEVSVASGEVNLAGTLTIPAGEGPFPAVLLLSGSGTQDRNEEIFYHKPFLVIADDLTRAGIAVLRVDDRGIGGSGGDPDETTLADLAADALSCIAFLRRHAAIDSTRIGLLGHSLGGAVACLAAARQPGVAFVVLLAAPGVRGAEVIVRQVERLSAAGGAGPSEVQRQTEAQKKIMKLVAAGADSAKLHAEVRRVLRAEAMASPDGKVPPDSEIEAQVAQQMRVLASRPYASFVAFDPRPVLLKLTMPVLALGGELDLQVDPAQNLPEIRTALMEAGNEDVTATTFPQLNHLFQKATTGAPEEYAQIEETIDPRALRTVRDWIRARTRPR